MLTQCSEIDNYPDFNQITISFKKRQWMDFQMLSRWLNTFQKSWLNRIFYSSFQLTFLWWLQLIKAYEIFIIDVADSQSLSLTQNTWDDSIVDRSIDNFISQSCKRCKSLKWVYKNKYSPTHKSLLNDGRKNQGHILVFYGKTFCNLIWLWKYSWPTR